MLQKRSIFEITTTNLGSLVLLHEELVEVLGGGVADAVHETAEVGGQELGVVAQAGLLNRHLIIHFSQLKNYSS